MTIADFKETLIKRIRETDNQSLLEEIYRLLDIEADDFGKLALSDEEKEAIKQGRKDIEKGDSLSDEQANQEVDEWLNE